MGYFLFMQEQRRLVPSWSYKSNPELQILCDPLWKELSREEKLAYKERKKFVKTMRKNQTEIKRQTQHVKSQNVGHEKLSFPLGEKVHVVVGHVEKSDVVWVTPVKQLEKLQVELAGLKISSEEVDMTKVLPGGVFGAKFSEDGLIYRCRVVEGMDDEDKLVTVKYIDFGNQEKVGELTSLPEHLSLLLPPLAVRVTVGGMKGVSDTVKNRNRVNRRLDGENLMVCLDRKGVATFNSGDKEILFVMKVRENCRTENEIKAIQELEKNVDMNGNLTESSYLRGRRIIGNNNECNMKLGRQSTDPKAVSKLDTLVEIIDEELES